MEQGKKIRNSLGIHDGIFHADEVTAAAFLVLSGLVNRDNIVRTRDVEKLARCEFVCDVGGVYNPQKKLFDHHQADYKGDLSSAGMILLYLQERKIISEEEYKMFNNSLVIGIDAHDNGKAPQEVGYSSFSHVIANFTPISYSITPEEIDSHFFEALSFVEGHLHRLKKRYEYNVACRKIVATSMAQCHTCLFFDKMIPWQESFFALGGKEHPALFIIMPAGEHWKLRAIPPDYEHRMQVRLPLPEKWAGLLEEDLKKVTGLPGAVFCHKGRFTSVWQTKEEAILALKMVLIMNGIPYENTF